MKSLKRFLGILSAILLIGGGIVNFVSCSSSDDDDDNSDKKSQPSSLSISVEKTSVTLKPGATTTVKVTANDYFTAVSSDTSVVEAKASYSNKNVTITAKNVTEAKTATITLKMTNAPSKTAKISVTVSPDAEVTYDTMNLTLNFAESIGAAKVSVLYYPGDGDSANGETLTAAVANNSATVALKGTYVNDWKWINAKITVLDSADNDISGNVGLTFDNSSWGGDTSKCWFEFTKDTTISVSCTDLASAAEKFMTLNLNFDSAIGATSVKVRYYDASITDDKLTDEDGKTETLTVTDNAATVSLSDKNASAWGFNAILTVYKNEEDVTNSISVATTTSGFGGDCAKCWFPFAENSTLTLNFTKDAEEISFPYTSATLNVESAETYTKVLPASAFTGLTVKQLIVTVSSESSGAWASLSAASSWTQGLYFDGCLNTEKTITDETFINGVIANGLYMESSAGDFVVTVKYSSEAPSSDTYTQLGSDVEVTCAANDGWWNLNTDFSSVENVGSIKIVASLAEGNTVTDGWLCYADASAWKGNFTKTNDGFEVVITDSDVVSSITGNGGTINIYGSEDLKLIVKVFYGTAASN